jgi:predicted membrane chloride channel (bestrophin family)
MMNSGLLLSALAGISVLTSLTVQALKKILDEKSVTYSSNILAVVVAIVLTLAISIGYVVYTSVAVTPQVVVTVIALMFLSFLTATVGYDKVVQALKQLGGTN